MTRLRIRRRPDGRHVGLASFAVLLATLLAACATEPPAPVALPEPASIARLYDRPAERALINGIRLYDEGTLDRAEIAFKTALGQGLGSGHDIAVAHKYLAFIGCAFNRLPECEQSFRDAIAADRTFGLTDAEIGHPVWGPVYRRVMASQPPATRPGAGPASRSEAPPATAGASPGTAPPHSTSN